MSFGEWETVKRTVAIGQELRGRVVHLSDFGAFVDLGFGGVMGLILAPDLPVVDGIPRFPSIGDCIQATVLGFRDHNCQVALGAPTSTSEGPHPDEPPQPGPSPEVSPPR